MTRSSMLLPFLLLSALLACDGSGPRATVPPSGSAQNLTLGGKKIDVTVIATEKERRHAVARLEAPTESAGYLLAYPRERFLKVESDRSRVAFDLIFLDRPGMIVDVQPLKAQDSEGVVPKQPAAYVLLAASGLAQKLGVKVGDKVLLSPEVSAVKAEELATIKINGVAAAVELALTEPERQHGLMFRPRMSVEEGMLFAYPDEGERRFWMANTLIPLDIAFFAADGTLLNVNETPMYPDPRNPGDRYATSDSKGAARYVLEMNLGWFKRTGLVDSAGNVRPGTKAEIPAQATKGTWD